MPLLLEVRQLAVAFPRGRTGWRRVVDGVTFDLEACGTMALVGESGCGKTLTALSLLALLPRPGRVVAGQLAIAGHDVLEADEPTLCRLRGGVVGIVFQEPSQALNPVVSVGSQVAEAASLHLRLDGRGARARAAELLAEVGLSDSRQMVAAYPHQLSGGQRQRVLIACALAGDPKALIADEPTSALDTLTAGHVLGLLSELRARRGLGLVLISHDLPLVSRAVEWVTVLYAGETVEISRKEDLFARPHHPYTAALLKAVPGGDMKAAHPLPTIPGSVPHPDAWGGACRFARRCPAVFSRCLDARPALVPLQGGRFVRCFLHSNAEEGNA